MFVLRGLAEFNIVRARLTPVTTEERQYLPSADDIKTEALHKELDSLDQVQEEDTDSGVKVLKNYLEEQEETSSSSPEEIEAPAVSGAGAGGLRDLLERTDRERSSSGEEWEKVREDGVRDVTTDTDCWSLFQVSITTEMAGQAPPSSDC